MNIGLHTPLLSVIAVLVWLGLAAGCATCPTREVISCADAPAAIGPYSQAVRFGNMLFLSGQIPIDHVTGQVNTGPIEDQTRQVLNNLNAVLAANGMTMADVVST